VSVAIDVSVGVGDGPAVGVFDAVGVLDGVAVNVATGVLAWLAAATSTTHQCTKLLDVSST